MKKVFSNRIISVASSVIASVTLVSLVGYAATTISTNVNTGGTLTVSGASTLTGAVTASGNLTFDSTTGTTTISGGLRADTADNTLVVDFSSSTIGVGTTSPGSLFSVHGNTVLGSADASIVSFRAGDIQLSSNATTTITTKNLLGININSGDFVFDTESNKFYVGSSTPIRGRISAYGTGTTTLVLGTSSAGTAGGSCIEMDTSDGRVVRIYASTTPSIGYSGTSAVAGGYLVVEAGGCQ